MEEAVIQLSGITKKYGDFVAVDNLNLEIKRGEIFGLLGPNGAGKSTTILMMLGLTEPTSGSVTVCGINSVHNPVEVKRRVGYLPEDVGFYTDMTGLENLVYIARLNGIAPGLAKEKALKLLERVGLADVAGKKTGKYSKGMRQRLGLAEVLIKNPEVIILDEPTSGIDPKGINDFLGLINELRDEHNVSILFSSHNLYQVEQVCDRVGIFVEGKLLAAGNIKSLAGQLFDGGTQLIEVGVENGDANISETWMKNILAQVEGIKSIKKENGVFSIECSENISAAITRKVIENGADINYLKSTEYGLDTIYSRYFEKSA